MSCRHFTLTLVQIYCTHTEEILWRNFAQSYRVKARLTPSHQCSTVHSVKIACWRTFFIVEVSMSVPPQKISSSGSTSKPQRMVSANNKWKVTLLDNRWHLVPQLPCHILHRIKIFKFMVSRMLPLSDKWRIDITQIIAPGYMFKHFYDAITPKMSGTLSTPFLSAPRPIGTPINAIFMVLSHL